MSLTNAHVVMPSAARAGILCMLLLCGVAALANVPGGIIPGTNPAVTLTDNGGTVTMSNGIVSILCNKAGANITQINYTYNNGNGAKTTQLLNGGNNGGELYWEFGNFTGITGDPGNATYSIAVNPATGNANHAAGSYGEIDFLTTSSTAGTVDVHFSMLRGSPGFYVTGIWSHRAADAAMSIGETRTNIYNSPIFNWMTVDPQRNKLMEIPNGTSIPVPGAPQECSLWINGVDEGHYEDKYKDSAIFGYQRTWGYSSVGSGGYNIGLWNVLASTEYYNGGPMKRELMAQVIPDILNMLNGGHYDADLDGNFAAGELWTKTYGPYFVYCNNVSVSNTNAAQTAQLLYNDAVAQAVAEAPAWPYSWFVNANYTLESGRGTVTGQIVISDTGNPYASGSNLWVGVVRQPITSTGSYDFQQWLKPYQFWVQADSNGNFTIPSVISGTGYTLYAFGTGSEGTFMSQNQTGGNPQLLYNLPSTPFSVTVASGSTTNLGAITWNPTRAGATVFEIGYPDRTARKFRHGEDYWMDDNGASPTTPSPIWTKFLEYPFDFPDGMTYNVGTSRWTTDWNYVQPVVTDTAGNYNPSTGTITFTLPSAPPNGAKASFYIGLTSADAGETIVSVNGNDLGTTAGVTSIPGGNSGTGYSPTYNNNDTTVREGINAVFSDERLTFPASLLKSGTNLNAITINMRKGGYFANHIMYDYVRLELPGYIPPAPSAVAVYPGNDSILLSWPLTPGATSYNVLRSTTPGTNYVAIAGGSGITGPVCGSGPTNANWLDTTATNSTVYYYVVRSVNTTGTSANSSQSAGVAPSASVVTTAPAMPAGVVATGSNRSATVSWTPSPGASYYIIQRSTMYDNNGGTYNTLGTITLSNTTTATTYTDASKPVNGTIYSYTVTAVNASGTSEASAGATAVPAPAAPAVGTTLTITPGAGQVTLNWTAVPGAVGYVIKEATAPGGPYTYIASITELTYVITGLNNNTTYYFTVQPTNYGGSAPTPGATAATTPLAPPASLTAAAGNTQITLTWPAVSGATGYTVERGAVSGGPYTPVGTPTGVSYTDNGLANGVAYCYVVATNNANGAGPVSAEATATPVTTLPVSPSNLKATPGNTEVVLTWTVSAGATGYIVGQAGQSGGPYTSVAVTGTTYTSTGLTNGKTYYYVVAATNAGGTGSNSNEVSATLPIPVLEWHGGVSTAWDTVTNNWLLGGDATAYVNGDAVTFDDSAGSSAVLVTGTYSPSDVIFDNSILAYTLTGTNGGMISGTTGLVISGSAAVVLAGVNTFTGQTVVNKGVLQLINPQALLGSTLDYNSQGGTLSFGPLTSCTIGGLTGAAALSLTGTSGTAVALAVGYNGQECTYSGSLSGTASSLLKTGTGTLILAGSNGSLLAATAGAGILSVSTHGVVNGNTANITGGQLQINGGVLSANGTSNITAGSGGLLVNSGTASFTAGLTTDAGVDNNLFIGVTGGLLNMASLFIGRNGTAFATQPAAGSTTSGLYVNGGSAAITGQLDVCNQAAANSSESVRIDAGALTVGSTSIITLNNGNRWSVLDINGGVFTSNDETGAGIQLGGVFTGNNTVLLVRNGVANTDKITFGDGVQTSGVDVLNVTGGALYIGAGGMVAGGAGAYTTTINLSGTGTLGALADWSSPLNMTLGGDAIQAGDALGDAYNITLSGTLTGTTLMKTGNGTLLLSGSCSIAGATTVTAGVLKVSGTLTGPSSVTISNGATFYLAGGSLSVSGGITNNGIFKISGVPSLALAGSFVNNGVLDLINSAATPPPNFVNDGTVLNASNINVQSAAMSGSSFTLTIQSYVQHTYQLQGSTSLTNPAWKNMGSSQAGTGGPLQFTDSSAGGLQKFYQILVGP